MSSGDPASRRLLIVAPIGRDAELMCTHLEAAGLECAVCTDLDNACVEFADGAGALIITEEALQVEQTFRLVKMLDSQPPWSDVPIIVLAGEASFEPRTRSFGPLSRRTNVTFIDRPVRIKSLVSAAQSALSARQRQYEIRDLMEKLEARVYERDRFLAILGHELRNPLGAILLAAQMKDEDGKLDGEHAAVIERQSKHLTRLVNDLLDMSRVVSGKIVLKQQPLELADQIVSNVLSNAIKYTPSGGHVIVTLDREDDDAVVRVQDDGVGIDPNRINTIFELFAQAENAIGRAQGGMGIGLALVRNLLQLHGGSIVVSSDGVGHGSEFVVRFPIANGEPMVSEPRISVEMSKDGQPRHIVIVEDNDDVRELLRLKLRRLGHSVSAVGDGPAGVVAIVDSRPDLALVDIGLPGFDGYQVAARVRESLGRDVVLVAVSGFGQPEDKRKALDAGFDEHITKPADVHDIENLLARFPPRPTEGV